jgi:DNA-binding MarR family transcriptional regulator
VKNYLRHADNREEVAAMSSDRAGLLAELTAETRRYLAAHVLFNQVVAGCIGIHPTDLQCLNLLSLEAGPLTTGQLAELTGLTTGSATRLVDRLERAGFVTRQRDPRDRRRVFVALVPEKMDRIARFFQDNGQCFVDLREQLTDDEIAVVTRFLRMNRELSRSQVTRLSGPRDTGS